MASKAASFLDSVPAGEELRMIYLPRVLYTIGLNTI